MEGVLWTGFIVSLPSVLTRHNQMIVTNCYNWLSCHRFFVHKLSSCASHGEPSSLMQLYLGGYYRVVWFHAGWCLVCYVNSSCHSCGGHFFRLASTMPQLAWEALAGDQTTHMLPVAACQTSGIYRCRDFDVEVNGINYDHDSKWANDSPSLDTWNSNNVRLEKVKLVSYWSLHIR